MSTTKVSALAAKGTLGGSEEILINDGGTSKKATITAVRTGVTDATKLPLAGGTMTGNIVMSGSETVDGVDISARDAVLTSTTTTANAALPKAGGEMTGNITMAGSQTVDGRDISADGAQLDTNTSAIATKAPIANPTFTGTVAIPNISDLESAVTANTAKVTNATHTGDVTGATALTIANDAVTVDKLNLISTGSVPSLEAKGTSGVTDGYIQLNCSENSHGIKLKSPPHSAGASYTLTFPNDDGNANEVLTTNGSGVLSWSVAAGGNTTTNGLYEHAHTISSNYSITSGNNAITAGPITINSGVSVTVPTGSTWVVA